MKDVGGDEVCPARLAIAANYYRYLRTQNTQYLSSHFFVPS